jgi:hypothetical protein
MEKDEFRRLLIEVMDEYIGYKGGLAPRWENGTVILKPGNETQPKEIPVDVFFKKIVSIRDSLRVLEQKINSHADISQVDKQNFQAYITKAYGSLTTFNILFREDKDKFHGAGGGKERAGDTKMSLSDAKKKLGLNEY